MLLLFEDSDPLQALLAKFAVTNGDAGVFQDTQRYLAYHIGLGRYACYKLTSATAGVQGFEERYCVKSIADNDAGLTKSSGWTNHLGNASVHGGFYSRASTTSNFVEWTTPAGVTEIGAWGFLLTNAGLCLITIDGNTTLANQMPTAQDLVTAGTYPNTILIANGGTLNPTDRVWDQYDDTGNPYIYGRLLATVLAAAAHTIRLTVTGYKRAASSDIRLYFAGFFYSGRSAVVMSTSGAEMFRQSVVSTFDSRWEFALSFRPTVGGLSDAFIGHSNTTVGAFSDVQIDGGSTTLSNGEVKGCTSSAAIVVTATHTHPDTGVTQVAHSTLTYTIKPTTGLDVAWSITWDVAGSAGTGYAAMMNLQSGLFTIARNLAFSSEITLNINDGNMRQNAKNQAFYMRGTNWAAVLYLPNLTNGVNNWAQANSEFFEIQDRTGGTDNKIYAVRHDITVAVAATDTWTGVQNYRASYFADASVLAAN